MLADLLVAQSRLTIKMWLFELGCSIRSEYMSVALQAPNSSDMISESISSAGRNAEYSNVVREED